MHAFESTQLCLETVCLYWRLQLFPWASGVLDAMLCMRECLHGCLLLACAALVLTCGFTANGH